MAKEINFGSDTRRKIKNGIDTTANVVKVTLGPRGRNVVIKTNRGPMVTKDGVTAARSVVLEDEVEDLGAQLCKMAASKTNDVAGDGTTSSTVLAQAMVEIGASQLAMGVNPINLKRGIDKAVAFLLKELDSKAKKITLADVESIKNIATISSNDPKVGEIVADAFIKAGENGIVTLEPQKLDDISTSIIEGFEIDRGYINPYFATDYTKMICEYSNAFILFWGKRITNPHELVPLLKTIAATGRPLLIVADDVEGDALAALVYNKAQGSLDVVAVKSPGMGQRRDNLMEDMAMLTGGQYLSETRGIALKSVTTDMLGQAEKIIVTRDSFSIVGGKGDKAKIKEHIDNLKAQSRENTDPYEGEKISERIAKLSGSAAIVKVGATTEVELAELIHRVEDAINATKAALEDGIISGGGVALFQARKQLKSHAQKEKDPEVLSGMMLTYNAIKKPLETILENGGFSTEDIAKISLAVSNGKGYDGKTGKIVNNMLAIGIKDPVKVTKSALENAASIASMYLTIEASIVDIKEKTSQPQYPSY